MTSVEQLGSCSQDWLLETCGWSRPEEGTCELRFPSLVVETHTFFSQFCISLEAHHFFLLCYFLLLFHVIL